MLSSVLFVSSCVNEQEELHVSEEQWVASVSHQQSSVSEALNFIDALIAEVPDDDLIVELENVKRDTEDHLEYLDGNAGEIEKTVATLRLQKKITMPVGMLQVKNLCPDLVSRLSENIKSWIGEEFAVYYETALFRGKSLSYVNDAMDKTSQQYIDVDAFISDVEAGLRKGVDIDELSGIYESVQLNSSSFGEFVVQLDCMIDELEVECVKAISAMGETVDAELLSKAASQARAQMKSAGTVLEELMARVEACEEELADIKSRLEELETTVGELLDMIQSLTFVSDYASEYAVAYYEMDVDAKVDDSSLPYYGKALRTGKGAVELNYFVRPASAAKALHANAEAVQVFGYYADRIALSSVSAADRIDFTVDKVDLIDESRGLVTVTATPDLKDAFYYKAVGAKCAVSIQSGKTDITSKFVEIIPVDYSADVYVTDITLSADYVEIDKGDTYKLSATVTPSNADLTSYSWSSSDEDIFTVNSSTGLMTAVGVGEATLIAKTHGVDEWGLPLTAECRVKVNEAFRLSGPPYVEVGYTADLILDYPASAIVESKVWKSSDPSKATVDQNGRVSAESHTYLQGDNDYGVVTISCTINGITTVSHNIKVVDTQPKKILVNDLSEDTKEISVKVDQKLSLASTIYPDNVNPDHYRLYYASDQALGWINSSTGMINEYGHTMTPVTAWVYIDVFNVDNLHYFAPGASLRRTLVVKVEPYYVETLSFQVKSVTLEPGKQTFISPVFTSDVDGKQPTYTDLIWTSSNPAVVSIDEATGEITTHKEGTAVITAAVADSKALKPGVSSLSASCTIAVEEPVAPINIGDYYYSDGTWSTQLDRSKTVIGVVFSTLGAATADKNMMDDYPTCTHGLVVALPEYSSVLGQFGYSSVYGWLADAGYETPDTSKPNGYGLTKGMTAYRDANSSYAEMYDRSSGPLAKHKVAVPSAASSWYIPSYAELKQLHANKSVVNAALSAAGGTQVTGSMYWSSTLRTYNSYNDCQGSPFDMVNGGWYSYDKKTTSYPVRIVLAF